MANIRIYRLPKTTDVVELEAQSKPMRIARLKSLRQDPASFISKYEDEVDQPQEFWHGRLSPDDCQHFVAVAAQSNDSTPTEFKAFMVVLSPKATSEQHGIPTYQLAAFWVDPEVRGQKIGSRIVDESIRWLREDVRLHGWTQARYQLHVAPDNHRAIRLYDRLGFSAIIKTDEEDDDSFEGRFVEMRMNIDVT